MLHAAAAELIAMGPELDGFQPYHAAAAAIHARHGNWPLASHHQHLAITMANNDADRILLARLFDAESMTIEASFRSCTKANQDRLAVCQLILR